MTLDSEEPIGEINTTPLVDVMLVLLIIFLITIPVINASIKVDLPEERLNDAVLTDDVAILSVTKAGQVFFNG
ncbi:biopolymer transporter ExbD, partial [Betaproteobacteria bacterium]|nr:biopolymer transporter ExbD [Betaproteobacteria bacterium]